VLEHVATCIQATIHAPWTATRRPVCWRCELHCVELALFDLATLQNFLCSLPALDTLTVCRLHFVRQVVPDLARELSMRTLSLKDTELLKHND
jgi:hypothetical protein